MKNLPAVWETWVQSLGWEDPLEQGKATHSSILAQRIPWTAKSWTWLNDFHFHFQIALLHFVLIRSCQSLEFQGIARHGQSGHPQWRRDPHPGCLEEVYWCREGQPWKLQPGCLANLLGLPQESTTDGGLKPSPLIFFIAWGLEVPAQSATWQILGRALFLACKQLPSCCVLVVVETEGEREGDGAGRSSLVSLPCCYLVAQSCLTLCNPMDWSPPGSSVHGVFHGKNTVVGCHFLLQGIFPAQESNLCLCVSCIGRQFLYHWTT